jgi:hypothetical protein
MASAAYHTGRSFVASFLSLVAAKAGMGLVEPVAIIRYLMYDETPLKASAKQGRSGKARVRKSSRSAEVLKIENAEFRFAILLREPGRDKHLLVHSEVVCPLQHSNRTTGKVAATIIENLRHIPSFDVLAASGLFPVVIDMFTRDRASGNLRAEAALAAKHPSRWYFGQACTVHSAHTIAGRVLNVVGDAVSGAIAFGLAQKSTGATEQFRSTLREYLKTNAVIVTGGLPPAPTSDVVKYRTALLDTWQCGRNDTSLVRRRIVLERHLQDDWTRQEIRVYVGTYVSNTEAALKQYIDDWADDVTEALVPCSVKVFACHRWCTSAATSGELLLLMLCHNILTQIVPAWLAAIGFSSKATLWDDLGEIVLDELEGDAYWAAFAEKQRGDALRFVRSSMSPIGCALWHKCLQPAVRLMDLLLRFASESWDDNDMQDAAKGLPRAYRVVEAATGRLTSGISEMLHKYMTDDAEWMFLPPALKTQKSRSLAFCMLAQSAGGIHAQLASVYSSYPYRLFLLIDPALPVTEAAHRIYTDLPCTWCDFTVSFRQRFRTEEDLTSNECRYVLISLAHLLRLETARVECRHAWLRRLLISKGGR